MSDKPSMFDTYPKHVTDVILQGIADDLLDSWMNNNLDEGTFWADYQIAMMCDDDAVQKDFNEYYELTPDDDEYIVHLGA
jgi:hypothetical protein